MHSPFKLSPGFFAATALLASTSLAQAPAFANDDTDPLAKAAATIPVKAKTVLPVNMPVFDSEAPLQAPKFVALRNQLLEMSVRTDLTEEKLHEAARKGIARHIKEQLVHEALLKAFRQGLAKHDILEYTHPALTAERLQEAVDRKIAQPGIVEFVRAELAKPPEKAFTNDDYVDYALKGMFQSVSPHDNYFNESETREMTKSMTSSFTGIGITLEMVDDKLKISGLIPGGPAEKAGLQKDDVILGTDSISFAGMSYEEVLENHLRGEEGASITLKVQRGGTLIDIPLVRAVIKEHDVTYKVLDGGVAYFHVKRFSENIAQELREKIAEAKAAAMLDPVLAVDGGLKGAILDFRGNSGGHLNQARQMADDFIDKDGFVVTTEGRDIAHNEILRSTKGDILNGLPLVVLVDASSASASELVPNALQDHGRAIVMGTPTYGKGTVQRLEWRKDGTSMKITIAQFHRPSGTSNQLVGTVPDIGIDTKDAEYERFLRNLPTERSFPHALKNDHGIEAQKNRTKSVCAPANPGAIVPEAEHKKGLFSIKGKLNVFAACARDYILKQNNPGYMPTLTTTQPYSVPEPLSTITVPTPNS